jgi:hypothetical protein
MAIIIPEIVLITLNGGETPEILSSSSAHTNVSVNGNALNAL